jgi:RNA polymerase sigma-70 factor (ECF subfamily)
MDGPGGRDDDRDLVARSQRGDRAALDALLRRHHDRVHLICLRMCRDREDADDAAQESLIAIVKGLDRFDGRSAFSTWAYRVTTNCCTDELRRRRRRPVTVDRDDLHEAVADDEGPAEQALRADDRADLLAALAGLPEDFRAVVVLRDVADLDYATIGAVLDLPPGTVRSRLSRARARLAEALAGNREAVADVEAPADPVAAPGGAPSADTEPGGPQRS